MALVDIDDRLKDELAAYVEKHRIDFPTMKNFCDKAVREALRRLKEKEKV